MKRLAVFLFVFLLLPALCLAAADDEIMACLRQAYPGLSEAVTAQCGDAAAAALEDGGVKTLCLLEKQNGAWRITLSNPTALHQDRALPALTMESANALSWTYSYTESYDMVYSSFRDGSGWSAVIERDIDDCGDAHTEVRWENGCFYYDKFAITEGGGGVLFTTTDVFPGQWAENIVRLETFDVSRFPTRLRNDWHDLWPSESFMTAEAAALMPDYTFVGGSIGGTVFSEHLQFLMDRPDGARVFVGCYMCETAGGYETCLVESTPLPKDTRYGAQDVTSLLKSDIYRYYDSTRSVDDFTWSLDMDGRCVTLLCNENPDAPTWGVYLLSSCGAQQQGLAMGPLYVAEGVGPTPNACLGENPWSDVTTIDWDKLPRTFEEAVAGMNGDGWAIVDNPNPADRLNLRAKASQKSASLGKYYNDTPVKVLDSKGEWTYVDCFGRKGWMRTKFLNFNQPYLVDFTAMPEAEGDYITALAPLCSEPGNPATQWDQWDFEDPLVLGITSVAGTEYVHLWLPRSNVAGFDNAECW